MLARLTRTLPRDGVIYEPKWQFLESRAGVWLTRTARQALLDSVKLAEDRLATALPRR